MNKKLIICVLVMLMMLTGCEVADEDTVETTTENYTIMDYKDPETGVHYLIYTSGYQGGLSVRYNADGTIMID